MKVYVKSIAYNLEALHSEPVPKFSRNLEIFEKCKENVREEVFFKYT